jgi:hypothetical protein
MTYWFSVLREAVLGPSGVIYDERIVNVDSQDVTIELGGDYDVHRVTLTSR